MFVIKSIRGNTVNRTVKGLRLSCLLLIYAWIILEKSTTCRS